MSVFSYQSKHYFINGEKRRLRWIVSALKIPEQILFYKYMLRVNPSFNEDFFAAFFFGSIRDL